MADAPATSGNTAALGTAYVQVVADLRPLNAADPQIQAWLRKAEGSSAKLALSIDEAAVMRQVEGLAGRIRATLAGALQVSAAVTGPAGTGAVRPPGAAARVQSSNPEDDPYYRQLKENVRIENEGVKYALQRVAVTGRLPSGAQFKREFGGTSDVRQAKLDDARDELAIRKRAEKEKADVTLTERRRVRATDSVEARAEAARGGGEAEAGGGEGRRLPNLLSARGFERLVPGVAGATAGFAIYEVLRLSARVAESMEQAAHPERVLRQMDRPGGALNPLNDPFMQRQAGALVRSQSNQEILRAFESVPVLGHALGIGTALTGTHARFGDEQYQLQRNMEAHQFIQQTGMRLDVNAYTLAGNRLGAMREQQAQERLPLEKEARQGPNIEKQIAAVIEKDFEDLVAKASLGVEDPAEMARIRAMMKPRPLEEIGTPEAEGLKGQKANVEAARRRLAEMKQQQEIEQQIYKDVQAETIKAYGESGKAAIAGANLNSREAMQLRQEAAREALSAQLIGEKAPPEERKAREDKLRKEQAAEDIQFERNKGQRLRQIRAETEADELRAQHKDITAGLVESRAAARTQMENADVAEREPLRQRLVAQFKLEQERLSGGGGGFGAQVQTRGIGLAPNPYDPRYADIAAAREEAAAALRDLAWQDERPGAMRRGGAAGGAGPAGRPKGGRAGSGVGATGFNRGLRWGDNAPPPTSSAPAYTPEQLEAFGGDQGAAQRAQQRNIEYERARATGKDPWDTPEERRAAALAALGGDQSTLQQGQAGLRDTLASGGQLPRPQNPLVFTKEDVSKLFQKIDELSKAISSSKGYD